VFIWLADKKREKGRLFYRAAFTRIDGIGLDMIKTLVIIGALIFCGSVFGREVTLTWEANSEPDLSHYVVYWGTASGIYTSNSGNIGLVTEYKRQLPNDGKIYFFAVTAVDTAGLESDYSNEVNTGEVKPKLRPELTPPGKFKFNRETRERRERKTFYCGQAQGPAPTEA
jgi:hypothetical protein